MSVYLIWKWWIFLSWYAFVLGNSYRWKKYEIIYVKINLKNWKKKWWIRTRQRFNFFLKIPKLPTFHLNLRAFLIGDFLIDVFSFLSIFFSSISRDLFFSLITILLQNRLNRKNNGRFVAVASSSSSTDNTFFSFSNFFILQWW